MEKIIETTKEINIERKSESLLCQLSDKDLYARCQEYGTNARVWKRRFAGLLPEVLRRELHRKRGFASIHEFSFKLAGMSSVSVDKILYLSEKLADKPILRAQLESGEQGWSKIEKVAFIATPETDKEWAEKVEKMTQPALTAYVAEKRLSPEFKNVADSTASGELDNKFQVKQWGSMSFSVSPEVEKQIRLIKFHMEKEKGQVLTYNEVMQALFNKKGQTQAQVVIQVCPECAARKAAAATGRAIPVAVQRLIQAKYQGGCAFRGCLKPATSLHHTDRFALTGAHDPSNIVPLCKSHERLVHCGLIENEESRPEDWRILNEAESSHPKFLIDQKVQFHRKEFKIASLGSP